MPLKISLIVPGRNNLKYFKWSYDSIRKNQGDHDVEICFADDNSSDGTWEWISQKMKEDKKLKAIRSTIEPRLAHTILYDKLIREVATHDICMIWHCDMYLAPRALDKIEYFIKRKTIVSLTRVEPPLHPSGPEKLVEDFGTEPENFKENDFLMYISEASRFCSIKYSNGVFAPWAFYKEDFLSIGGHDALYYPQSKEDCVTGDSLVFVEIDGSKEYMDINSLWSRFENISLFREDGVKIIDFKKYKYKVRTLSAGVDGKIKFNILKKLLKKEVISDRLLNIRTQWGEVTVTEDHSLIDINCNPIKVSDISYENVWKPLLMEEYSFRKNLLKSIDFNKFVSEIGYDSNTLPIISDIDEYGTNLQLLDICEFFGFYVAEGSVSINLEKNSYFVSICGNNLDKLNYFKNKSESFFGKNFWLDYQVSKKEDFKEIYSYRKGSKKIAHVIRYLCGSNSETKQVPNFIYNLPKAYQEAFLYGYLCGDGYLGTSINRQNTSEGFSVDKRLFFKKNVFDLFTWKSTSKSKLLTAGINFLLKRCFPKVLTRIHFQKDKGSSGMYNLSTCSFYKEDVLEVTPFVSDQNKVFVYDLEVNTSHTFIAGVGLFGVHNSDIFNRFKLSGFEFIQARDGFVYHMTCRGSRFNPTITKVGHNSSEWENQNVRSTRNFIRKWGSFVKHDKNLHPIVTKVYNKSIVLKNATLDLLYFIEPRFNKTYIDNPHTLNEYIEIEQPNTLYNLRNRVKLISENSIEGDIIVEVDCTLISEYSLNLIDNLSSIIEDSGDLGEFSLDVLKVNIKSLKDYSKGLILVDNKDKLNTFFNTLPKYLKHYNPLKKEFDL